MSITRRTIGAFLCFGLILCAPPLARAQWRLVLDAGATGTLDQQTAGQPSAVTSCRVVKSNGAGSMRLIWEQPVPAQANKTYLLRSPYRTEDASVANLLLLRATRHPEDTPSLHAHTEAFAVWTGQSLMRNAPPGGYDTRLASWHAEEEGPLTLQLVLYGNPCTLWLGEPRVEELRSIRPAFRDYTDLYDEAEVRATVARRSSGTAHVADHLGRPTLFVNDQPVLPTVYKGVNATRTYGDYAAFAAHGIHLANVAIATGDTTGHHQCQTEPVWLGQERFALERIDAALLRALRRNPQAQIILDIRIDPYKDWGQEHPDEIIRNAQGERAYSPASYVGHYTSDASLVDPPDSGRWWCPSWQSEVWCADLENVFERIAQHVRASELGKSVVGFFITGHDDGQFVVNYHDHSLPTQRAFRAWLQQRYGALAQLNAAWKSSYGSFDEIQVPVQEWRQDITHYAPGPQPDFRLFKQRDTWRVRERLAAALKRAIGRSVVVLVYAAPYHHAFVDSPSIDAVGMQPDYAQRRPGFPLAFNPLTPSTIGNKLLFTELDLRSTTGEAWPTTELYLEWVSAPRTGEAWRQTLRKVAGFSLAAGYANWYYDMGQYWNDPHVHREIEAVQLVTSHLMQTPKCGFRADVCAVVTENDKPYLANDEAVIPYDEVNFHPAWMQLAASGVPYERHALRDILARSDLQDFKVYLFLHNSYLSTAERQAIAGKLQGQGRTLVWGYGTGYVSELGKSTEAMSSLIGMNIDTAEEPVHRTVAISVPGIRPFCGGAEMYFQIFHWGHPGLQAFWVDDPQSQPLATYVETGQVAIAEKRMGADLPTTATGPGEDSDRAADTEWRSIYIGAPQSLSDDLLNQLARDADAYVAGPAGHYLCLSGEFASLHALRTGSYTLVLPPGRTKVLDADSREVLSAGAQSYTFPVVAQQTYWLLFQ